MIKCTPMDTKEGERRLYGATNAITKFDRTLPFPIMCMDFDLAVERRMANFTVNVTGSNIALIALSLQRHAAISFCQDSRVPLEPSWKQFCISEKFQDLFFPGGGNLTEKRGEERREGVGKS